jgi:hypothetical protein
MNFKASVFRDCGRFSLLWALAFFSGSLWASENSPKDLFKNLLSEYKRLPKEFFAKTDGMAPSRLESINTESFFSDVSEGVQKSRYNQYNSSYQDLLKLEKKIQNELTQLTQKLSETPLSNYQARGDLELKQAALKNQLNQSKFALFMASVNANLSVEEALKTISSSKKEQKEIEKIVSSRPKLPGVWGGSTVERLKQKEREKLNLTPVDPEFYETQLGKKLESDLGGRADYWSYDYGADDLYVKVGSDVGKVTVFQDQGGIRFIRTRVGVGFSEPRNADAKIDLASAKGRFLTGDKNEETLFGPHPGTNKQKLLDEKISPTGKKTDLPHDHKHDK